jgi:hypothetical protein
LISPSKIWSTETSRSAWWRRENTSELSGAAKKNQKNQNHEKNWK